MSGLMIKVEEISHKDLYRMSSSELFKKFGDIIQKSSLSEVSELFDKIDQKFTSETEEEKKGIKKFLLDSIERKACLIREHL